MRSYLLATILVASGALAAPPTVWSDLEPASEQDLGVIGTSPADSLAKAPVELADALRDLRAAIDAKGIEIAGARVAVRTAEDETTAKAAEVFLENLHGEAAELERRFARLVAQADEGLFTEEPKQEFDPTEKVLGLLEPVFQELEQLTANSREISRLENAGKAQNKRGAEAARAIKNIEVVLADDGLTEDVRAATEEQLAIWKRRSVDAEAQMASIEYELAERRKLQKPFLDAAGGFLRRFLRTRGFNLAMAVLAFCAVFFGMGALRNGFARLRPSKQAKRLGDRVADLLFRGVAIVSALAAMLMVFNATGDWFLLGIALAFLVGLGWVAVKAAPQFTHQITLVLNMGAVREGEFILYDDVPWMVETLGFTTTFVNDRLDGGIQRLPVRMLVGMHSRPLGKREELFPCRAGDWVRLEDGTTARVSYQTPSVVEVVLLGGSQKTYSTANFLALNPQNMSTNYRVEFTFGVDYRHQADATTVIPETLEAFLTEGLGEVLEAKELLHVEVEFKEAAASSLDYEIQIDVAGSAAAKYEDVERRAARLLVEACTKHDWDIPFQQVTIHGGT